jgi:tRNA/tmRNA/rRNA uracil-C5-methylase (TrmA/RlmC/RlmD family)
MKYLKKIFENNLMLDTNILGDILQEITDLGYLSHVNSSWWSANDRSNGISVCIYGKDEYDKIIGCEVAYIYPDEVMEVIERLIDFLGSEGYKPYDKDKKEIEVIKGRPTEKTKQEIKVPTSSSSQVTMRWDDKISGYKVCYSLSIEFKQ